MRFIKVLIGVKRSKIYVKATRNNIKDIKSDVEISRSNRIVQNMKLVKVNKC